MRHRAIFVLLALMGFWVPLSHLETQAADDSWLLLLDGRPIDVVGYFSEKYTTLTRDCSRVRRLEDREPLHAAAREVIGHYSPPDSQSVQLLQVAQLGHWLLVQAKFNTLQAAVVVVSESERGLTIPEGGVWSGATHPFRPAPTIRRYLHHRVPTVPRELIDCMQLESEFTHAAPNTPRTLNIHQLAGPD